MNSKFCLFFEGTLVVYRQQISLVVVLMILASPVCGGEWVARDAKAAPDASSAQAGTLSGTLKHNSADQGGVAPYVLLDRWGVVRGYVSPAAGMELEQFVNREVTLQGAMKQLPGGDMPLLTTESVTTDNKVVTAAVATPPSRSGRPQRVQPAAYQQEVIPTPEAEGRVVSPRRAVRPAAPAIVSSDAPEIVAGPGPGPDCGPGCADGVACGPVCGEDCGPCFDECLPCWGCPRPHGWVRADYVIGSMRGMRVPALVTTGPNAQQPGILGEAGTTILFGNDRVDDQVRSGGRIQFGLWLGPCQRVGIEGEYFALDQASTSFRWWSDGEGLASQGFGNGVISRPFFDTINQVQSVENVAIPRTEQFSLDGAVTVDTLTHFQSAGARMIFTLCRAEGNWSNGCRDFHDGFQSQFLIGYRYLQLSDSVMITEQLTGTDAINGATGAILEYDSFRTKNQFNGVDLGLSYELRRNRWLLGLTPKVALGNNYETITIDGGTRTTPPEGGSRELQLGGLLARDTNIGTHTMNKFAAVPELTVKLGYQFSRHLSASMGYNIIYVSQVARAGDQIDLQAPPRGAPGETITFPGGRPAVPFAQTSFWTQGVNFGAELRW